MRELTYLGKRSVEWRDVPEPKLQADTDAIVTPVAGTTCDLDTMILDGRGFLAPPFPLGHECVARVVEVGGAVSHVVPGDLVVVPWTISCGRCGRCLAGLTGHCEQVPDMAMFGTPVGGSWGGLFADLARVPWADTMLVPLPAELDPITMASAGDNWSLAWRLVVPHLEGRPGARVLVNTRGSVGLYVCDVARALGAADVLYVDPDAGHRKLAETFGARTAEELDEPIRHGFDLGIEATGQVDELAMTLRCLAPGGFCESAGNHLRPGRLPMLEMYATGVTLRVARDDVRAHIPDALALAASGRVEPERIVSGVYAWDRLPEVLVEDELKPVFVRDLPVRPARGAGGVSPDETGPDGRTW